MREPHFEGLRGYADEVARQPGFAVVRQRAARVRRRRRRAIASSAAALVAALFATGLGYAATGGPQVAAPTPSTSAAPEAGWPRVTSVVATGSADLYAVFERCRDCTHELYASGDAGATWQRRSLPPAADGAIDGMLVPLGRDALAWRKLLVVSPQELELSGSPPRFAEPAAGPPATDRLWTTIDGGRTWRRAVVDPKPVAAVPPGARPVDCHLVGQPAPCRIYALDPVTGRFAPLAHQPSGITFEARWTGQTDVPLGAHLWLPGLDPATRRPAVASSSDAGRTWHTHVFAGGLPAVVDHGMTPPMYLPMVAAGPGRTAYALIYRDQDVQDPYRSTDGGATWRPVPGAVANAPDPGFVTADGAHVVRSGQGFRVSRDGGRYQWVTLPGYPAELHLTHPTWQQAAGRYLAFSDSHLYLSDDGWTWRRVDVP